MSTNEFVGRNTSLFQQTNESADFQLTVIRYDASHGTSTQYYVAPALACHNKAQALQHSNDFCSRNDGKLRHEKEPGMWSETDAP